MPGLPRCSACVWVMPPLLRNGPSLGQAILIVSVGTAANCVRVRLFAGRALKVPENPVLAYALRSYSPPLVAVLLATRLLCNVTDCEALRATNETPGA